VKVTATEEARRRAAYLVELFEQHGIIDDSAIAFPDDDEIAALKREAREAAERRRAAARKRGARKRPIGIATDEAQSAG
jgi:hypothetical protein